MWHSVDNNPKEQVKNYDILKEWDENAELLEYMIDPDVFVVKASTRRIDYTS